MDEELEAGMDCETFRDNWTEWREGWLEAGAQAMQAHRDGCEACARFDRQMRATVDELATLPLPGREHPPERQPAMGWAPRWAALAATLIVGVVAGALLMGPLKPWGNDGVRAQAVTVASTGVQEVAIAFESPEHIGAVQFEVALPPGVELVGSPGQRVVRWQGELAKGATRLKLPLRIRKSGDLGRIVARVRHDSGERKLVIPLRMRTQGGANDTI